MRLGRLVAGVMVTASILAGSGCGAERPSSRQGESTRAAAQAIQGGTVDTTSTFAVGVCNGTGPIGSGNCFGVCSGALILPNVVATARHCIDRAPLEVNCGETFGSRKGNSFRITTNTTMDAAPTGWYAVDSERIYVPTDDQICGNDLALLVLKQSVPSSVAKPITPGIQYLMWDPEQYVPYFIGIGYGITSPNGTGDGTRRISKPISVLCVPGSTDLPCPAEVNPKEFIGGDGICSGDSGSSAFESGSIDKGAPVSFGVLSRGGESSDGTTCEGSAYTRFDAHREFVLQVAKEASKNWTLYPEPSWTAYKPSPGGTTDGGADSGTSTPSGLGLGETCAAAYECSSGVCSDTGDGTLVCSKACDASGEVSCPDGYECREDLCLPRAAAAAPLGATTTTTTTGCAASRVRSSGAPWAVLALGTLIALGRRKRHCRCR